MFCIAGQMSRDPAPGSWTCVSQNGLVRRIDLNRKKWKEKQKQKNLFSYFWFCLSLTRIAHFRSGRTLLLWQWLANQFAQLLIFVRTQTHHTVHKPFVKIFISSFFFHSVLFRLALTHELTQDALVPSTVYFNNETFFYDPISHSYTFITIWACGRKKQNATKSKQHRK